MDKKEELWKLITFKNDATLAQIWQWCRELTSSHEGAPSQPDMVPSKVQVTRR